MRKRAWTIEWKAQPTPDGETRLARAIERIVAAAHLAAAAAEVAARAPTAREEAER